MAGGVTIGDYAWIGMGAIIKQEVLVGQNAVVGMGSVVIKEIPNNNTVVGVPARVIKVSKE